MFSKSWAFGILAATASYVAAESHSITFHNDCSWGIQPVTCSNDIGGYCSNAAYLNPGQSTTWTHNGPLRAFISYGRGAGKTNCNTNGEGCLITEGTLQNLGNCVGCNSIDMSLIPPHAFNFGNSFGLSDNSGAHGCESSNCPNAFKSTSDTNYPAYQVQSNGQDISIGIDYCNSGGNF